MENFRLILTSPESTGLKLLAHQVWLLYLLPVKIQVGEGLFATKNCMILVSKVFFKSIDITVERDPVSKSWYQSSSLTK